MRWLLRAVGFCCFFTGSGVTLMLLFFVYVANVKLRIDARFIPFYFWAIGLGGMLTGAGLYWLGREPKEGKENEQGSTDF